MIPILERIMNKRMLIDKINIIMKKKMKINEFELTERIFGRKWEQDYH
jgi:hypothetical protein